MSKPLHHFQASRLAASVKVDFWYEVTVNEGRENERQDIKIDYLRFIEYLQRNGFGLLCHGKLIEIVRVVKGVVFPTIEKGNMNLTVKQFVLYNLRQADEDDVLKIMFQQHSTFFSIAFLTSLKPLDLTFYRDTDRRCCLFFENGFLEVVKSGRDPETRTSLVTTTFKTYDQLSECIWDSLIQPHEYRGAHHPEPLDIGDREAEFSQFLALCSTEFNGQYGQEYAELDTAPQENWAAFQYSVGYLVHNYKDRANVRAVICVDNDVSVGEANGRRGKSLLAEALKHLRKVTVEDGRNIKIDNNQFMLQTVELDSNILLIDDVRPKFDFAALYNCITGDWSIERKRESRLILEFEDAPKILITTNYAILGDGDSHQARWFILPFVRYFHAGYSPVDEFGHRFFVDWDTAEWQRFFDTIVTCLTVYFSADKPILADLTTYKKHKLQASMPAEYLTYFEEHLAPENLPVEVPKEEFYDTFKAQYQMFDKVTQNMFTSKLKTYCKLSGYVINPGYEAGRVWRTPEYGKKYEALIIMKEDSHATPQAPDVSQTQRQRLNAQTELL
jgi:hypothetical protein